MEPNLRQESMFDGAARTLTDGLAASEQLGTEQDPAASRVVNSYNEWDVLEEVVVGRLAGGVFPTWQASMRATMPEASWDLFDRHGGSPFPDREIRKAEQELDGFAALLQDLGVKVVRPEPADHTFPFSTPAWQCSGGLSSGMPRDFLMVIGDIIIEAPMSWRCRQHEVDAYRPLIKSYFRAGARWLPAPRPQLTDDLFVAGNELNGHGTCAITEFEPVFDAADFVRFGRDIVVQKSHVTNELGIRWLQQAIDDEFRVHTVEVNDPHAMHIDATIVPLGPGKLLVHPQRFVPNDLFRDWEILKAPTPTLPADWPMYFCSPWLSMNVLSLDERTVVVERQEKPLIAVLRASGFECIPVDFRHVYSFGGSFHCATLDFRRRGGPDVYLRS